MRRTWLLLVLIGLIGAMPVLAFSEADDLDRNRRLLDRWRAEPEHYQRLLRDLRSFYALPVEAQERIRRLDRQIHESDPATGARLWAVLDRYAAWMDRLSETDRLYILSAEQSEERLKRIHEVRDREWLERLPAATRKELAEMPAEKQKVRISQLRQEEQNLRKPRLSFLADYPPVVQNYLQDHLLPRLAVEEKEQLRRADGHWPQLPRTLYALAEKYPTYPPLPVPRRPVLNYDDLPPEAQKTLPRSVLEKRKVWDELRRLEGRWPEYALAVAELAKKDRRFPPLGASRPEEFPRETEEFITKRLLRVLNEGESRMLAANEGRWPDYPRRLHELARRHRLSIPGMSLPGPRELWDSALSSLPEVPGHVLRDFVLHELSPQDRADLHLSLTDRQASRERIKNAYFKKNPNKLPRPGFPPGPLADQKP